MNFEEFLARVQGHAQLQDRQRALRATRATLETLADRLEGGEAYELAAQLPEGIGAFLTREPIIHSAQRFDLAEFFRRVSMREGAPTDDAVHHARAVLRVVDEVLSGERIGDVRSQLPPDFHALLEATP